jgi:hypothetical protein
MDITLHRVKAVSVKDTVHEDDARNDGGFTVRTLTITQVEDDGSTNRVEVKLFSTGLTPAKLNI